MTKATLKLATGFLAMAVSLLPYAAMADYQVKDANGTTKYFKSTGAGTGGDPNVPTHNAVQSGTWTVQPGNTANTTAWKVDGSAVTQPVSGSVTATRAQPTFSHDYKTDNSTTSLTLVAASGSTVVKLYQLWLNTDIAGAFSVKCGTTVVASANLGATSGVLANFDPYSINCSAGEALTLAKPASADARVTVWFLQQ